MTADTVILGDEFMSPAVHARLDVLLIISEAFRTGLAAIVSAESNEGGPPEWWQVVRVFSDVLASEIASQGLQNIDAAPFVWDQIYNKLRVRWELSTELDNILSLMKAEVTARAIPKNIGFGRQFLHDSNLRAASWINQHIMPRLDRPEIDPARLHVSYDPAGKRFCASSSRLEGTVGWTLQPCKHTVLGALIAPRVLEHEYLSHLLPSHRALPKGILEVWLMETLEEEHRNLADACLAPEGIEGKLWTWFKHELELHFSTMGFLEPAELLDFEEIAIRIRRRSETDFWKMTRHLLLLDRRTEIERAVEVLRLLRPLSDKLVDSLTMPWSSFEECLRVSVSIGIHKA